MPTILVIDDSLFMRTLISDCLSSNPELQVITASSGAEALKVIPKIKPDCITLDLVLPGEDGLVILEAIMSQYPTPVIILSAHSQEGAELTLQCLKAGAVNFIPKPSGEISLDIDTIKKRLINQVREAISIPREKLSSRESIFHAVPVGLIVIGASTGGPPVIEEIVRPLPANFPHAILLVQHMPSLFFTQQFAYRLHRNCHLPVSVAQKGKIICGGKIYLAPSGFSTTFGELSLAKSVIHLTPDKSNGLTPSIDCVMESAADVWGKRVTGVLLTGMGNDGLKGMRAIKQAGGKTIAQDESALIFGMPREVIEAGLADEILPLGKIAESLVKESLNPAMEGR